MVPLAPLNWLARHGPWLVPALAVSIAPLFGVLLFAWDLEEVLLLFWLETAVIALVGVIASARRSPKTLIALPFFAVHFGLFMFVHLIFIVVISRSDFTQAKRTSSGFTLANEHIGGGASPFEMIPDALANLSLLAVGILVLGHAAGYLLQRPAESPAGNKIPLGIPYGRVMVMHFAIIIGAFGAAILGSPWPVLLLLIALKFGIDTAFGLSAARPAS